MGTIVMILGILLVLIFAMQVLLAIAVLIIIKEIEELHNQQIEEYDLQHERDDHPHV